MIDLKHLRAFLLVAEHRHFGRAAAEATVSAPTMSVRVKELETALGEPLFLRTSRRVELTEFGERFREAVADPMVRLDGVLGSANDLGRGAINLGVTVSTDRGLVVDSIDAMRAAGHEVDWKLTYDADLFERLLDGTFDLGVTWSRPHHLGIEDGRVVSRVFAAIENVVVLPEDDPLAQRESVTAAELNDRSLVLFERYLAPAAHDRLLDFFLQAGFEPAIASTEASQDAMARALTRHPRAMTFTTVDVAADLPPGAVAVSTEPRLFMPLNVVARPSDQYLIDAFSALSAGDTPASPEVSSAKTP